WMAAHAMSCVSALLIRSGSGEGGGGAQIGALIQKTRSIWRWAGLIKYCQNMFCGAGAGIENRSVNSANIQKYHHKYHHWRKSSSLPFHLERLLVTSDK
ncbi:MAG: hypothetical protein RSF79_03645, partial [Janthinobacterium sp.]